MKEEHENSFEEKISEMIQSAQNILSLRERMELEDRKGWDNIDSDTFKGNEKELQKFKTLKKDAINFLR